MSKGLGLNYTNGLNNHLDYTAMLTGSFSNYPYKDGTTAGKEHLLLELDASIRGKMLTSDHAVVPYLQAGIGGSLYQSTVGVILPAGMGIQVRSMPDAYLLINAQYRIGLTPRSSDHFFYGIGLAGSISKRKAPVKTRPAAINTTLAVLVDYDTDDDGVPDSVDACPLQKGMIALKGCSDADGDGIVDNEDRCPLQPGVARYQGCPIPDSDGDGIHDELDKCPTEKGLAIHQGCPDRDGDGIPDANDLCPDKPGLPDNNGCPLVSKKIVEQLKRAAQQIQFATGSARLVPTSFKAIDEVVALLQQDSLLLLTIEGHTDNTGQPAANQLLSEQRAQTVYAYLVAHSISRNRLVAHGYGQTRPVTTNDTAAGRQQNRRVVLILRYP